MLVLGGGLVVVLLVISVAVWALLPDAQDEIIREEASELAPGYQLVENDSGSLSAQVPSEWETSTRDDDILTGSPPNSEDESVGPSIVAAPDLDAFENRSEDSPSEARGAYLLASRELAQRFTDDLLVASGPNDYSEYCERGALDNFNRPPYSGKMQAWGCGDSTLLTLAVAPEGRECVVVVQIPTYDEADADVALRILETFEVDCEGIP